MEHAVTNIERKISTLETGVSVQTESLKVMTAIPGEANESSRRLERHTQGLQAIKRRLDRLDGQ